NFRVPLTAEGGDSTLVVVANGIPSTPVNINVIEAPPIESVLLQDIYDFPFPFLPAVDALGGDIIPGKVTLQLPAPEGGAVVDLSPGDPAIATVIPSVT